MSKAIQALKGVDSSTASKLKEAGCGTPAKLLEAGATKKGRKALAAQTGIDESEILKCVNMSDLFRIKGIATQYAELLEAAGVDTVKELRNRKPENLTAKMKETNEKEEHCRQAPGLALVQSWVEQAKTLDPVVKY